MHRQLGVKGQKATEGARQSADLESVRFESRWDLGVRSDKIFGNLVMKVLLSTTKRQSALVLEFLEETSSLTTSSSVLFWACFRLAGLQRPTPRQRNLVFEIINFFQDFTFSFIVTVNKNKFFLLPNQKEFLLMISKKGGSGVIKQYLGLGVGT